MPLWIRSVVQGRGPWSRGLLACAVAAAVLAPLAFASSITSAPVSTTIGTTNVTPMWGPQIPKVVYDGQWYYTTTLDGSEDTGFGTPQGSQVDGKRPSRCLAGDRSRSTA